MAKKYKYTTSVHLGYVDGKQVTKKVYADTKAELNQKVLEIKKTVFNGKDLISNALFGDWARKWYNEQKLPQNLEKGSLVVIEGTIKHLNRYFENVSIRDITLSDFQTMINDYAKNNPNTNKPMSNDLLKKIKSNAQAIFEYAEANNIANVPRFFRSVMIPKDKTSKNEKRRALTETEQQYIIDTPHRRQLPCMIMLFSGLRLGECLALEWTDIDLVENRIYVDKSLQFGNNQGIIKQGGKTANAQRVVPIPPILSDYLREYKQSLKVISPYVNLNTKGELFTKISWKRLWESYMTDLNLKYGFKHDISKYSPNIKSSELPMKIEPFTAHYLRHTYATMLILEDVSLIDAKQFLGHADIQTTINIYTDFKSLNKSKLSESYKTHLKTDYKIQVS